MQSLLTFLHPLSFPPSSYNPEPLQELSSLLLSLVLLYIKLQSELVVLENGLPKLKIEVHP